MSNEKNKPNHGSPPAASRSPSGIGAEAERKTSSLKKDILVALISALTTILATGVTAFITTDWFRDFVGLKSSDIVVRRMVVYARILSFSDKHKNEKPISDREIGLRGTSQRRKTELYDEGLYLHAYYLSPHIPNTMTLKAHSSGLVDLTPVIPQSEDFSKEQYEKTHGAEIECSVDIASKNYVLATYHYYNGFQYNERTKKYESNGGCHINYRTDEVTVVFDFSSLPYEKLIKQDPRLYIKKPGTDSPSQLPSTFKDGILVADIISKPPVSSHIYCDWTWSTEP
jgi:hypothetical protein